MMRSIKAKTRPFRAAISALTTRFVFTLHCIVAFWRIYRSGYWSDLYYLLFTGLGLLLVETIVTIKIRHGEEYKWFCPSVFLYLVTIVPCVWILEMGLLSERYRTPVCGNRTALAALHNGSYPGPEPSPGLPDPANKTYLEKWGVDLHRQAAQLEQMVGLGANQWIVMVEQILLFVLILGRWLLPKGNISRDELSQLLLVYIGMAADIIEFFEAFKEEKVKCNRDLIMVILAIWSASLFQFTLVLTASKTPKSRPGFSANDANSRLACAEKCGDCCGKCCGTEVFGIMTTVLLQDGPFLLLRILLLVQYEVVSYMHYFFTVKNTLVLLLMVYRLVIVCQGARAEEKAGGQAADIEENSIMLENSQTTAGTGKSLSDKET